jgi:CubicO group peptidase (beta-lactamase class C family)
LLIGENEGERSEETTVTRARARLAVCTQFFVLGLVTAFAPRIGGQNPELARAPRSNRCAGLPALHIADTGIFGAREASGSTAIGQLGLLRSYYVFDGELKKHTGSDAAPQEGTGGQTAVKELPEKLDVSRMNPAGLLVDKYSYMAQPYNFYYFHHMDELGFRTDVVRKGKVVYPLKEPTGNFSITYNFHEAESSLDDYFRRNFVTGFLVLHDNQIVYEKYFHGADQHSRFVSQSVGKSIVSILIGAAVRDGFIHSLDDPVTKYLPSLADSGYRDVTVKNLLHMSTGVDYSEDYRDPKSGAALIGAALITGKPFFMAFAASMKPTSVKPGTKFEYQSVNTQVLGLLLEKVTGKRLNQYAEEKLWKKIGAQDDAFFYEGQEQPDTCAFACFNSTVRDYGRVGLMMLDHGKLGANVIVPERWVNDSTTADAEFLRPKPPDEKGTPRLGYGYQWWLLYGSDQAFEALGIYGQSIYVNPARHVVIVQTSAWPTPLGNPEILEENAIVHERIAHQVSP